jgi:K+-transporting ATPase A subunit
LRIHLVPGWPGCTGLSGLPVLWGHRWGRSVAKKRTIPASSGTFRTDGPTFVVLLIGVVVLTAGLMALPALTLGPIVEALQ